MLLPKAEVLLDLCVLVKKEYKVRPYSFRAFLSNNNPQGRQSELPMHLVVEFLGRCSYEEIYLYESLLVQAQTQTTGVNK